LGHLAEKANNTPNAFDVIRIRGILLKLPNKVFKLLKGKRKLLIFKVAELLFSNAKPMKP
jgi:hypothetical protein